MRRIGTTRRRRAFTMVEVMAAITVSLILSVVAVASYRLYQHEMPVKYAGQRLSHAFAMARSYAVANNGYYALKIDRAHQNFWLDATDETGVVVAVPKVASPELFDEKVAIDGIQFGANAGSEPTDEVVPILFRPDGSSDDVHLYLRTAGSAGQGADLCTVRLYGPTGMSRVIVGQRL